DGTKGSREAEGIPGINREKIAGTRQSRGAIEPVSETLADAGHEQQGRAGSRETERRRSLGNATRLGEAGSVEHADSASQHGRTPSRQQPICDEKLSGDETLGDPATEGLQGQWSEYSPSGERCSGLAGLAVQAGVPQWNGPTVA